MLCLRHEQKEPHLPSRRVPQNSECQAFKPLWSPTKKVGSCHRRLCSGEPCLPGPVSPSTTDQQPGQPGTPSHGEAVAGSTACNPGLGGWEGCWNNGLGELQEFRGHGESGQGLLGPGGPGAGGTFDQVGDPAQGHSLEGQSWCPGIPWQPTQDWAGACHQPELCSRIQQRGRPTRIRVWSGSLHSLGIRTTPAAGEGHQPGPSVADPAVLGAAPSIHPSREQQGWAVSKGSPEGPWLPFLFCTLTSALGHLSKGGAFRGWGVLQHKFQVTSKIIMTEIVIITTIVLEVKLAFLVIFRKETLF